MNLHNTSISPYIRNMEGIQHILQNIKKIRKSKGYSQEFMADKLSIEQKTYSTWETGRIELTINRLKKLAEIFEIELHELLVEPQYTSLMLKTKQYDKLIEENKKLKDKIEKLENQIDIYQQSTQTANKYAHILEEQITEYKRSEQTEEKEK